MSKNDLIVTLKHSYATRDFMKYYLLTVLLFLLPTLAFAEDDRFSAQFRIGYFRSTDDTVKDIYGKGGLDLETELGVEFREKFIGWLNFNYFRQQGHSIGLGDRTTMQIYPLSAGIKFLMTVDPCIDFYIGIGASYTWISLHDNSPFVEQKTRKQGWGAVGKAGMLYYLNHSWFLDLFADYSYTRVSNDPYVNVGGARLGIGLGVGF